MRPGGCPPLHTQTFTLIIPGTQTTLQRQIHTLNHLLCAVAGAHTCILTHMQCEMNAGSHKLLFVPHQVCKYVSCLYLQFTAKSSFNIVLYAFVLYFIIILSS